MTALQKKADNPDRPPDRRGRRGRSAASSTRSARRSSPAAASDDAAYIRKVIAVQRKLELASRGVLLFSLFPPAWLVGTAGLSVAKILENMEIGHNVLHGQWDWMRDPKIHSTTWEWDNASPGRAVEALAQRAAPHVHERDRQGQRPRLRHHAGRRGPALAPVLPRPAAVELPQRLPLRVRHRRLRPRDRQGRSRAARTSRSSGRGLKAVLAQDQQAGDAGLRRPPAAVRPVRADHARRERHRQPGPQPLVALGDHVRALPRGRRDLRRSLDRRRDPRRVVPAPDARRRRTSAAADDCTS